MSTRARPPAGVPCWADLFTPDVEGSRAFYSQLFGWEPGEPQAEFGGYFLFLRDGVPVAGGMGPMGDAPAGNFWSVYLATDGIAATLKKAEEDGAEIVAGAMDVADLGTQAVINDPTGAHLGLWQPKEFGGFSVLEEPGAPSWFELHTRDFAASTAFYRSTFGLDLQAVSDTDEFRYFVVKNPDGDGEVAGIMDAAQFLPPGVPNHWSVYWQVDDVSASAEEAKRLGGSVLNGPDATPYGVLATLVDPAGAQFKLRTPPAA